MVEKMTLRASACAQLDPCPFCGHDLRVDDPFDVLYPVTRNGSVWGVHCTTGNGGCDASMLCDGVDSAAAAWNRRAHLAQPAQAVCPVCGGVDLTDLGVECVRCSTPSAPNPQAVNVTQPMFLAAEKAGLSFVTQQKCLSAWNSAIGNAQTLADAVDPIVIRLHDVTAKLEAANAVKSKTCAWTQDEWDGSWDTACGNKHQFTDGSPRDNDHAFCPYCGGKLEVVDAHLHNSAREAGE